MPVMMVMIDVCCWFEVFVCFLGLIVQVCCN